MVFYKRKPVKLLPDPKGLDDNTEVWVMEGTGEVFVDYEAYLTRRDYYLQSSFTCEATGMSNLTYFEAKESEVGSTPIPHDQEREVTEEQTEAVKEINEIFPKPLRKPVLRFVQFRTETRMDDLVNAVFDHFRDEFFQDEVVTIEDGNNARRRGVITGFTDNNQVHTMYHGQMLTNAGYVGYIITMDDTKETVVKHKGSELQRDRKTYSKLILKQYLRATIKRESWIGAPWMVKTTLAKLYDIPTKVPDHKTQAAIAAQRQAMINNVNGTGPQPPPQNQQQAPNGHQPHQNGHHGPLPSPSQIQPGFHNFMTNGQHAYAQQPQQQGHGQPHIQFSGPPPYLQHRVNVHPMWNSGPLPYHMHSAPPPFAFNHPPPQIGGPLPPHLVHVLGMQQVGSALPMNVGYQTSFPHQPPQSNRQAPGPQHVQQPPQPARAFIPVVKYPCEDLDIKDVARTGVRPTLKFFSDDGPDGYGRAEDEKTGILMRSIGPLLGAWETLNVHDTIYMLDSFTYDDFVDAMAFSSEETECELFVEVHCSVLKQIINESGKIQAALPKMAEAEDSEGENSSQESSPEPEPEPPARTTRSSLRKSEAQQIVKPRTPTPEPPKDLHKAAEFVEDFNWIELCKVRNFRDGNWQAIVVALLYRLSFDPVLKEACDEILAQLVPAEQDNTVETIADNYSSLDVNLRVSALDILLRMTVTTEAFRDQLVAAAQEMTRLRKEKIDYQRKRKEIEADIARMELDRKILLPENTPASPSDMKENDAMDVSMTSAADDSILEKKGDGDGENDAQATKGKNRPVNKNKRKAAAEEARKEKAKKAKAAAELSKKQKEWEKLLADIQKKRAELAECEANICELDDDLRETLVHRSKALGKDRFLNKYYWFEHNGMPFGGVPNSSTAEYGYANGRIWVQGPDKHEFQPNLEEPGLSQDKQRLGFTIPERKQKEEGETHLSNSTEWAYYDDPADIDALVAWLDDRGLRERSLKKEILLFKDHILKYMGKMREHLDTSAAKEIPKDENEMSDTDDKPRVSTRNRASADKDKDSNTPRCLRWTNSIMREEYGHVHHDEYEPPRKAKAKATAKSSKSKTRR